MDGGQRLDPQQYLLLAIACIRNLLVDVLLEFCGPFQERANVGDGQLTLDLLFLAVLYLPQKGALGYLLR